MKKNKMRGRIGDVLARHAPDLMAIAGVVGVYEGEDENQLPCLRVMLLNGDAELRKKIPRILDGFAVEVEVSGEVGPL